MKKRAREKWRFLEVDWLTYAQTAVLRPILMKTVSEHIVPNIVSFCTFPGPSVILNFFNDPDRDIDLNFCRKKEILVYRVLSSGGPIFGDKGYIFTFIHAKRDNPRVPSTVEEMFAKTLSSIARGLSKYFNIEVRFRPLNDLEARCPDGVWRKIGPSSCFFESEVVQMGSGLQIHRPDLDLMASIITQPLEKFRDKEAKNIQERISCLDDVVGRNVRIKEIKETYIRQVEESFGVDLIPGKLSKEEQEYFKKFEVKYTSEDFVMDRSEKRLEPVPAGVERRQMQYKIPGGPLIRILAFIQSEIIWRMLITGTVHASPLRPTSPVHEIERTLIGAPIDRKIIEDKIIKVMTRPNYEMPKVDPKELAKKIELCCRGVES